MTKTTPLIGTIRKNVNIILVGLNSAVNKACGQKDGPVVGCPGMKQAVPLEFIEAILRLLRSSSVSIMENLIRGSSTPIVSAGSHSCTKKLARKEKMGTMNHVSITVVTSSSRMSRHKKVFGLVVNQKKEKYKVA